MGIFTLFKLIAFKDENTKQLAKDKLLQAYIELLKKLNSLGVAWLELDEPYLVYDLNQEDIALFEEFYKELLKHKGEVKILLQSYFGDLRDIYTMLYSRNKSSFIAQNRCHLSIDNIFRACFISSI